MAYALSFAPEFFWGDGATAPDELPRSEHPTSVYQAILSLADDEWAALARDVFNCPPEYLEPETVLTKVQETNTCRNLDSPVEVFVDVDGWHTLLVFESAKEASDERADNAR
jgi:hypothetical protein